MRKIVLLSAVGSMLWLTSCNRNSTAVFQKSTTPAYEHQVSTKAASLPAAQAQTPVVSEPIVTEQAVAQATDQPAASEKPVNLPKVTPEMLASASERLVAQTKGTKYEKQALMVQKKLAKIQKNAANGQLQAANKATATEKFMTKMVTKKVQKQLAKAKDTKKTNALDRNVKIGLILLLVGLIFLIIPVYALQIVGLVMMIIGAVVLLIGLLDNV
ncbi:hypothetical protein [Siphonobacter curvatus]|uniref:Uncharacterized protein n=1 Tax=Siphonobacter curvatus TaxID=2094562 RepID=A0A2S7ING3_9BACT|nr:hypothetical protein [Siphonobacter curvatus]PQA59271.1 hypothetical protein C5O19_06350 [Siphonobacter curvatus]